MKFHRLILSSSAREALESSRSIRKPHLVLAAFAVLASVAVAQQNKVSPPPAPGTKEALYQDMRDLAARIERARERFASDREVQPLLDQYEAISASLGGDDPANLFGSPPSGGAGGYLAVPQPCSGTPLTLNFAGTTGAITPPIPSTSNFTTVVSGAGIYLWDVDLHTAITHTGCGDLDMTLTSPSGTVVTIATDCGGSNDNVFNGTVWDDAAVDTAADKTYTNLVTATPLAPEGRLEKFRGENPNGTWTLTILDDTAGNSGSLNSWSLNISTLNFTPLLPVFNFSDPIPRPIPPGAPGVTAGTVVDTMVVSGMGPMIYKLQFYCEIAHTFTSDLDITLTSPQGTVAMVTTDNGGSDDNVFNGTLWYASSPNVVTDFVTTNLVVVPHMQPEGGFDRFLGEDPNGTWTLTIVDDAGGNSGSLNRWDLDISADVDPFPSAPVGHAGTTGAIPDFAAAMPIPTLYTTTVSGMGPVLWDVDLSTAITHGACGDLDMTLTSPAGRVVKISTDNGGLFDDVFNGTRWDDNVNDPCTDHVYANLTLANPLSPEGRLTAFRGEDPNGTWTLTVVDDALGDNGTVNSWSLDITSLSSMPPSTPNVFSRSPQLPIPPGAPTTTFGTTVDTMAVSGIGTAIAGLRLYTDITHTFVSDLDITLKSPGGTIVTVTTDAGGGEDDVFAGTSWDPASINVVSDYAFTNLVVAPLLSPEGSFDNFIGQDPNGTWTLTIVDDFSSDVGALHRWDLSIATCGAPVLVYCTPKTNSFGCVPAISATGLASATATTGFTLRGSNVRNQKPGLLLYTVNGPAAVPFTGGTLCVNSPIKRTPGMSAGGNALPFQDCSGVYQIDMNSFSHGLLGGTPLAALTVQGTQVHAQFWGRDNGFTLPNDTTLTDGIRYDVGP